MLNFAMLFLYTVLVLLLFAFPHGMVLLIFNEQKISAFSMLNFQIIHPLPLSFSNILFFIMCIMFVCLCVSVYTWVQLP